MSIPKEDLAIRLIEERGRLGYSQADFAKKTDITREGLRLYETGQRRISADFLVEVAALGGDVQYIISGVKSTNLRDVEATFTPTSVAATAPTVAIGGSNTNVIGLVQTGATVHQVHTQNHVTKTVADVKPGDEHISETQAATLTSLVKQIVETEEKLKKSPASHRAVWGSLNAHCKVTKYRLIPLADFEKAAKYLRQWLGRLNAAPSAPVKNGDVWRKTRYAYIKANSKNDQVAVQTYMQRQFDAQSLTELSDEQLNKVYRYVSSRKRTAATRPE